MSDCREAKQRFSKLDARKSQGGIQGSKKGNPIMMNLNYVRLCKVYEVTFLKNEVLQGIAESGNNSAIAFLI
jgi:hypothetical protein